MILMRRKTATKPIHPLRLKDIKKVLGVLERSAEDRGPDRVEERATGENNQAGQRVKGDLVEIRFYEKEKI